MNRRAPSAARVPMGRPAGPPLPRGVGGAVGLLAAAAAAAVGAVGEAVREGAVAVEAPAAGAVGEAVRGEVVVATGFLPLTKETKAEPPVGPPGGRRTAAISGVTSGIRSGGSIRLLGGAAAGHPAGGASAERPVGEEPTEQHPNQHGPRSRRGSAAPSNSPVS
jgi:hypothetical protein